MIFFAVLLALASAARDDVRITAALQNPAELQKMYSEFQAQKEENLAAPSRVETRMRLGLFRKALQEIASHNSAGESYYMAVNQFADMTDEEMNAYTGANMTLAEVDDIPAYQAPLTAAPTASSKDWRSRAVTKVKNQGKCGSCWVFSAVGALEGAYKLKGSVLKSFSEQEGLECSMRNGCGGGWMRYVYNYAKKSGRLAAMKDAPYKGREGSCRFSRVKNGLIAFKISGYTNAAGESNQVVALSNSGPLSVDFTVHRSFFRYGGDIYRQSRCSGGGHAVTMTGFTSSYFMIKNSWGSGWGLRGYIKFGRGNVCGINSRGLIPTLTSTGTKDDSPDESGGHDDDDDDDDDIPDKCTDNNDRCPEWAARTPSECTENWKWMTTNCQLSCKQCECVDVGEKCEEWKGKGYCEHTYTDFMTRLCRKTCDKCKKDDDDDNNGDCQKGFKKCPDGTCVHEHWDCNKM